MSAAFTEASALYNSYGEEPDWSRFDAIEVMPVLVSPDGEGGEIAEPLNYCEKHLASIWSVYGHLRTGGVECIHDTDSEQCASTAARIFEAKIAACVR